MWWSGSREKGVYYSTLPSLRRLDKVYVSVEGRRGALWRDSERFDGDWFLGTQVGRFDYLILSVGSFQSCVIVWGRKS